MRSLEVIASVVNSPVAFHENRFRSVPLQCGTTSQPCLTRRNQGVVGPRAVTSRNPREGICRGSQGSPPRYLYHASPQLTPSQFCACSRWRTEESWHFPGALGVFAKQEKRTARETKCRSEPVGAPSNNSRPPGLLHLVPHLEDSLGPLERHPNPLLRNEYLNCAEGFFGTDYDVVLEKIALDTRDLGTPSFFLRAGPRESVVWNADDVKVAIVTCGGLCPGINTVVRELVNSLWELYTVRHIRGIRAGYRGFYSCSDSTDQDSSEPEFMRMLHLSPTIVDDWHKKGGSILGTSRGGFDLKKIVDSIEDQGFTHIFVIGGDGSMRGAVTIFQEVERRKLKVSVVGIPKTVDNDIAIIDKSFGLETAVEKALAAIDAAHVEAESTPNGIGVVKLMGRNAGHIAVRATLSSRDVDCCLIPEVPFFLEGEGGLLEFLDQRIAKKGHCVVVVAEGAGQELIPRLTQAEQSRDASGNLQLLDVGTFIVQELKKWWAKVHPDKLSAVKYIDPTYMVRAVRSNASDTLYCTLLANSAVHGAMAGHTGFIAGPVNGVYCYIPMTQIAYISARVDVSSHTWGWVRASNNQPDFGTSCRTPPYFSASSHNHYAVKLAESEKERFDKMKTAS